jgi:two-component system sensor histidine kinase UhpB
LLQLALLHDDVPNTVRASIAALQNRARALLEEIGALAWRIRPAILDDVGLTAALTALTDSMGAHGSARIETALPQQLAPMSREAESAIYRIAQEALTNALRHACAATITLHLQVDDTTLLLGVIEDGCTPPDAIVDGPGLRGMRERALMIGGQLTLEANQPQGLRVRLALPLGHLGG